MRKKHFFHSFCIFLLYITIACKPIEQKPIHSVQFEIEETNLTEDEGVRAIVNIQNRLESIGAENVKVDGKVIVGAKKNQKVTFNYQGNIKSATLKKSFSISGKLEFFEVCKEREILYAYLRETYGNQLEEGNLTSKAAEEIKGIDAILGITITGHSNGSFFAIVSGENKEKVTKMLLRKEPFFVSKLKKRVKFLLGRNTGKGNYDLYAVYVTSENKAPLDGSYVIGAAASWSSIGTPMVTIQKNEEGAKIWEQMTGHAYQTQGNIAVVVDDIVYSAPSVSVGPISGGKTEISGSFTEDEARDLANAFRAGSIPKMKILQESILKPYK